MVIVKETEHKADHSKKGALLRVKRTRLEADHSKRGALVIIKQTRHEVEHFKGNLSKGKADEA